MHDPINAAPAYEPGFHFFRNRVLLPILLFLIGKPLVFLKGFRCKRCRPKHKTFLLLANHNDILDPAYEMAGLMRYVRYVTSDHVIRGFGGRIINYFGTPIIKRREQPSDVLTSDIKATLKAGVPVGLHAEGGTSFNGETRPIGVNTARLIREADCAVITYRIHGGYLRTPRWCRYPRKGPLYGGVVREYAREELAKMSIEEILSAMRADLYVNAYIDQREKPGVYKGRALAEYAEIELYLCPVCKGIGTLHSLGSRLSCECGYTVEYGEDGFFHDCGSGVSYDNIRDWEHFQQEAMGKILDALPQNSGEPLFSDANQKLSSILGTERQLVAEDVTLSLYRDKLTLTGANTALSYPLDAIRKMEYVGRQTLLAITGDAYYELTSPFPRSPVKYIDAWRRLTNRPSLY